MAKYTEADLNLSLDHPTTREVAQLIADQREMHAAKLDSLAAKANLLGRHYDYDLFRVAARAVRGVKP